MNTFVNIQNNSSNPEVCKDKNLSYLDHSSSDVKRNISQPSQKEHDFHNTAEAQRLYQTPVMSWRSQRGYHLFSLFYLRHELATFK